MTILVRVSPEHGGRRLRGRPEMGLALGMLGSLWNCQRDHPVRKLRVGRSI